MEKSIAYFEEAIRIDPTFAPAYVGLADGYADLGTVFVGARPNDARPKSISAARKALELDPTIPEAHTLLAIALQEQFQWSEAEVEYRRALELNPNDARVQSAFARWLVCQGRTEEAQAWSRRARELDPLGVRGSQVGWILFMSRQYDEAIREIRSDLAVHPDDATTYWFLGFVLVANGQAKEAIPILEKTFSLSGRSPAVLGVLVRAEAHGTSRRSAPAGG